MSNKPDAEPTHQFSTDLNAADALLWNIEKDPCLRSTIVAVSLLDRTPDWQRLVERISQTCEVLPRMRERVVTVPLQFGPPRWQRDEFFDLDYHLRRVAVPDPSDPRSVLDIAGRIAMGAFDKDRPLWEFTLVEGLHDGRAAFIQKVHHSFTDGVGAVRLAALLLDTERDPSPRAATAASPNRQPTSGLTSIVASLASDVRGIVKASVNGGRALPGFAVQSALHPTKTLTTTVRGARSIAKLLAPVTQPLSPIMTERGLSRRLDSFDVPLAEMMAAAHRANSTLNDAFLASLAGGMGRYHERHGAPVDTLRVTMPISTRRPGDPPGSNHFTPARFAIPISTADAAERMQLLGELARNWRHEPALPLTDVIAGVLNRLPVAATTSIFGSMLKAIDFVATNIPGLDRPTYLAGAQVTREYAFAPPSGAAFSAALLSHVDRCCVGINIDLSAVRDPEVLTACLREGFDEILAVAQRP